MGAITAEDVARQRLEKDEYFRNSYQSPLGHGQEHNFKGLKYFDYSDTFKVAAVFGKKPVLKSIKMETSKGHEEEYLHYGQFDFEIDSKKLTLQAYKPVHLHGEETLFIPFRDGTSGKETYGAGRYLDLREINGNSYVIDFNLTYNPFCVYSEDYVCPLPPKDNWLKTEIRAGEKDYKKE